MTRHDFTADLPGLPGIECEVDVSAHLGEDLDITVLAVWSHGVDLLHGDQSWQRPLGLAIAALAEVDDGLIAEVMAAEGISYRGIGANDPDAHFVQVAA